MWVLKKTWSEVKKEAEDILYYNRSNNKKTYKDFQLWDEKDRTFILELMSTLDYFEYKYNERYYKKLITLFYEINNQVEEYNRPITDDNRLSVYALTTKFVVNEINKDFPWSYDDLETKSIINRYKTYRGMAKLSHYNGDLKNDDLTARTIQRMMEDDFSLYLKDKSLAKHRKELQGKTKKSIATTLQPSLVEG